MRATIPSELVWLRRVLLCYVRQPIVGDIGGGRGDKALYIAVKNPYIVLMDIDAVRRVPLQTLNNRKYFIDAVAADAHSLPIRDEILDAVLHWNVLMFLDDDRRAVQEVARVLKRLGLLLLSVYRVQTGYYNYSWARVNELLSRAFRVMRVEKHGAKQIKVVAVKKPTSKPYKVVRVDVEKLLGLLRQLGIDLSDLNIDNRGSAVIMIPLREPSTVSSHKRWFTTSRANLVSFAILNEIIRLGKFNEVIDYVSKSFSSKCLHSSKSVYEVLRSFPLNRVYAEKLANDLVRLGIFSQPLGPLLVADLCSYVPSYRFSGYVRYTPYILGCDARDHRCLASVAVLFNPLLRNILSTIGRYVDVSLQAFTNITKRNISLYLRSCFTKSHDTTTIEYRMLDNPRYVVERIIEPLQHIGLIIWNRRTQRLRLSETAQKVLTDIGTQLWSP